jgi:hypothetical protein
MWTTRRRSVFAGTPYTWSSRYRARGVGDSGVVGLPADDTGHFAQRAAIAVHANAASYQRSRLARLLPSPAGAIVRLKRSETGGAAMVPTSSSAKPGALLLPIVLASMTVLVAAFLALASYGVIE